AAAHGRCRLVEVALLLVSAGWPNVLISLRRSVLHVPPWRPHVEFDARPPQLEPERKPASPRSAWHAGVVAARVVPIRTEQHVNKHPARIRYRLSVQRRSDETNEDDIEDDIEDDNDETRDVRHGDSSSACSSCNARNERLSAHERRE